MTFNLIKSIKRQMARETRIYTPRPCDVPVAVDRLFTTIPCSVMRRGLVYFSYKGVGLPFPDKESIDHCLEQSERFNINPFTIRELPVWRIFDTEEALRASPGESTVSTYSKVDLSSFEAGNKFSESQIKRIWSLSEYAVNTQIRKAEITPVGLIRYKRLKPLNLHSVKSFGGYGIEQFRINLKLIKGGGMIKFGHISELEEIRGRATLAGAEIPSRYPSFILCIDNFDREVLEHATIVEWFENWSRFTKDIGFMNMPYIYEGSQARN